jgi:transposase, IS5 family
MARTPTPTYTLDTIYSRLEGIEAIVLRTVSDQPTVWDGILPSELLVLPAELARVDALLDDPVFFAPFAAYFDARIGRPSIPVETFCG